MILANSFWIFSLVLPGKKYSIISTIICSFLWKRTAAPRKTIQTKIHKAASPAQRNEPMLTDRLATCKKSRTTIIANNTPLIFSIIFASFDPIPDTPPQSGRHSYEMGRRIPHFIRILKANLLIFVAFSPDIPLFLFESPDTNPEPIDWQI